MVASNLRHFTLKVGVLDPRCGIGREADLPLKVTAACTRGAPCARPPVRPSHLPLPPSCWWNLTWALPLGFEVEG